LALPKSRLVPCVGVERPQEMPSWLPLRDTLVLFSSISPRSIIVPLMSTKNLSVAVHESIWYKTNWTVTLSAPIGSGLELGGILNVLDMVVLPSPRRPRN
jgi:hypothetical protein